MNIDPRINELFSTITDLSHVQNINREAFNDISKALLSFHDINTESLTKTVCDASPGHGKTTVLIAYLKWITKQKIKQPVLIAVKEKQLAFTIFKEVSAVAPNTIINIDSDNKNIYESDLHKYQIIIIQHQRLKNFALGFGNVYDYQYFNRDKTVWGTSNLKEKVKRILIIDEKPDFVDSVIFDINSINNVLDWFEDLSEPLKLFPIHLQKYKSYIMYLLSEQLSDNLTDHTTSLFTKDDKNSIRGKNLITVLKQMKEHEENKNKYESLNKLKHFKKLLKEDNYGRIDDYDYYKIGRKIIISKLIDYSTLKMPLLVFDGTAKANGLQYIIMKFDWARIENRNDYSRLYIQVNNINTTKYSRKKEGYPTQKAISRRIRELYKTHNDLFILPMKEEISIYIKEYGIKEEDRHLYYDDEENHVKGVNLLNTTGKNFLKDKNALYLTCLPKKNADYYKCLAIAFYGDELNNLLTNSESDNDDWFRDRKLEMTYRQDLYSELLQIIHRTAIRKIDNKQPIHIYIAYDEEDKIHTNFESYETSPISLNLNERFLFGKANLLSHHTIVDMSQYGRDKKIEGFANLIKEMLIQSNQKELSVSKISSTFNNYIKKHWAEQQEFIINEFSSHNLKIYVNDSDKRKTKKVKLIN